MARTPKDIAASEAPIVLRFFGCDDEMRGFNGDYFTLGDTGDEDLPLPAALRQPVRVKLRFSRGAEEWRVTEGGGRPYYVNQTRQAGISEITSGDVVRLAPGGPGVQFLVKPQQDVSLARLMARHAPRLAQKVAADGPEKSPRELGVPAAAAAKPSGSAGFMPPPWARNLLAAVLLIAAALLVGYVVGSMRPVGEPGSPASDLAAENSPTP